jgi:hypothetical protein
MAALMKLRKKALEGDGRALDRYLELATAHAADEAAAAAERKLSAVEGEILARYVESCAGQGSEYPKDGATSAEARDDQPR